MKKAKKIFEAVDPVIITWMNRHGLLFSRIALGVVFMWFGLLKTIGESPANELVTRTVYWVNPKIFIPVLGWWEFAIGFCFLFQPLLRFAILLLFLQIGGTFLPLILLPDVCYNGNLFLLTIEGQYIVKNLLIISAAIVVGGSVKTKLR